MKALRVTAILVMAIFCITMLAGVSLAGDRIKVKGTIKDYDLANKTVVVATEDGKELTFTVESEGALKKLDDRLYKGDEVKVTYTTSNGKNLISNSSDLRGTKAGC